jgi:hypothetical protein
MAPRGVRRAPEPIGSGRGRPLGPSWRVRLREDRLAVGIEAAVSEHVEACWASFGRLWLLARLNVWAWAMHTFDGLAQSPAREAPRRAARRVAPRPRRRRRPLLRDSLYRRIL